MTSRFVQSVTYAKAPNKSRVLVKSVEAKFGNDQIFDLTKSDECFGGLKIFSAK